MLGKTQKDFIKLLLLFGGLFLIIYLGFLVLAETSNSIWLLNDNNTHLLSYEKEIQLGEIIEEYVLKEREMDLLHNSSIDSALWMITSRLKTQIPVSEYDYQIKIIESKTVNAYTIPGGKIFISKALISFCESSEQLAAVLAHEIAHVEKRHTVSRILKEFTVSLLFGIISGSDTVLLSELWKTTISSSFDRKQEKESDEYAMQLLEKAGISPRIIAAFFRKLNRENLNYNEKIEFLMSHPHNNARIKRSLEYKPSDDFKTLPFDLDWNKIKEGL
ncbi:MAG: M48 family metallopeptidase [Flavobacteriaceae bacterium]